MMMLALCLGTDSTRAGDAAPSEPQLKAAFLLNFPKYIEWPAASFPEPNTPIVIAILGDEAVASEFAGMSNGKSVDGHPIQLVRVTNAAQCRDCHIVFIGAEETRKTAEIVKELQGTDVLTVGENEQFMDMGGMINLSRRERRIVLEVNLEATRQTELRISSKLMALATVKGGKK